MSGVPAEERERAARVRAPAPHTLAPQTILTPQTRKGAARLFAHSSPCPALMSAAVCGDLEVRAAQAEEEQRRPSHGDA
eukprot:3690738-Rhodomonas_salina.1